MMKKILALLLSAAVVLGVVGCGGGSDKTADGVTKYRIYISATEVELEENETFVLVASYGDKKVNERGYVGRDRDRRRNDNRSRDRGNRNNRRIRRQYQSL